MQQLQILKQYYDITVLTVFPASFIYSYRKPQTDRYENGIRVVSIPYFPILLQTLILIRVPKAVHLYLNKIITHRRLLRIAKKLHTTENFDFVHGHESYVGDEAGPIGRYLHIPSFFTLHSFYYYHEKVFGKYVARQAKKNLLLCNYLISVSTIAAKSYIAEGLPANKFTIIPNGVNAPVPTSSDRRITSFARGRKVLLSVGSLSDDKRFNQSITTLAKLPADKVVLVIAGIGTEKQNLEQLAKTLNCVDRILWLNAVPPEDMSRVYQAADILLHPSVVDSFSMVCLEAMSHGIVVICNTSIGLCEFTKNGENIVIVPPDNAGAIVSATTDLLSNPSKYNRISQNAGLFARNLTWQHQVKKIIQLYNQAVK